MTRPLSELAASALGCLTVAALIYGGTVVIDDANDKPIAISHHRGS